MARRPRKPMTPEQRKAAGERLAKARAARAKNSPPKYTNIHPYVVALDDDETFSMKNVRKWINTQKELLSSWRKELRQGVKGAESRVANAEAYIKVAERYLREGVWTDMLYGEYQDKKLASKIIDGRICLGFYEVPIPK